MFENSLLPFSSQIKKLTFSDHSLLKSLHLRKCPRSRCLKIYLSFLLSITIIPVIGLASEFVPLCQIMNISPKEGSVNKIKYSSSLKPKLCI